MKMYSIQLESMPASPITFGRYHGAPKKATESHDAYEERTCMERAHFDETDSVFIPPNMLKNALVEAAKYLSEKIPGKGQQTYGKKFMGGVSVTDPIMLGIKKKALEPDKVFVPADGTAGGGKRVWRTFPMLKQWKGVAKIYVLDEESINEAALMRVLTACGQYIGLGTFRPAKNGYHGRFTAKIVKNGKNGKNGNGATAEE